MYSQRYNFFHIVRSLYKGQTVVRAMLNSDLANETIKGKVVDIGGGRRPDYYNYLQREAGTIVEPIDGKISGIDFEKDLLPHKNNSIDTVIICNVLEHMFNYNFLLKEIHRIMKPNAQMIGFVPFWIGYHPDPHDYFRYTDESLSKIFNNIGFKNIKIKRVGGGPFLGNFNTIVLSLPRFLRPIILIPYYILDSVYLKCAPHNIKKIPLGFLFTAVK